MNSVPRRVASNPAATVSTAAEATTTTRKVSACCSNVAYTLLTLRITLFSFSATFPVTNCATAAGTKVSDNAIAAVKAMTTVNAIGWNIFPETPLSAKIGR